MLEKNSFASYVMNQSLRWKNTILNNIMIPNIPVTSHIFKDNYSLIKWSLGRNNFKDNSIHFTNRMKTVKQV